MNGDVFLMRADYVLRVPWLPKVRPYQFSIPCRAAFAALTLKARPVTNYIVIMHLSESS